MSAPLMAQMRPMTIAEMKPGQVFEPGWFVITLETLPVFANGTASHAFQTELWLPPAYRESTPDNLKIAIGLLKELCPRSRRMIDDISALARSPKSREEARRLGIEERHYSQSEAREILRRPSSAI
ncbi:hypothetical protein [Mesorhizobium sp. CO1-1-4]|uniref:hypothetical protein n=1 Tax=Mesorhizobium sp. CO1-1-4 TaxID=2876633 RepID=UPI001CCE1CF3|nr:hypothetical protein [Mesorhizobium sp. CO1-1-4]MBZ9742365.1 hypothetical protein [Mesorhizobium sp. CO1-1-4]